MNEDLFEDLSKLIAEDVSALQFKIEPADYTTRRLVEESGKTGKAISPEAARKILERRYKLGSMVKFNRVLVGGYRVSVYRPARKAKIRKE
jgi:hypothetical protein